MLSVRGLHRVLRVRSRQRLLVSGRIDQELRQDGRRIRALVLWMVMLLLLGIRHFRVEDGCAFDDGSLVGVLVARLRHLLSGQGLTCSRSSRA